MKAIILNPYDSKLWLLFRTEHFTHDANGKSVVISTTLNLKYQGVAIVLQHFYMQVCGVDIIALNQSKFLDTNPSG